MRKFGRKKIHYLSIFGLKFQKTIAIFDKFDIALYFNVPHFENLFKI